MPRGKPKTRLRVLEVGGTKHTLEWPLMSEAELRAVCDMSKARFEEWTGPERSQEAHGGTWTAAERSRGESSTQRGASGALASSDELPRRSVSPP